MMENVQLNSPLGIFLAARRYSEIGFPIDELNIGAYRIKRDNALVNPNPFYPTIYCKLTIYNSFALLYMDGLCKLFVNRRC